MTVSAAIVGAAWMSTNARGYWRFRSALGDPAATQLAILMKYLRANANTSFGRDHGFSKIDSIDAYQAQLPLASYADFSTAIDAISRGEQGVLTRERVRTLALSSGSVSAAKRIPYTRELQKEFRRAIAPWMLDLAFLRPELVSGCAYWSITPVVSDRPAASAAPGVVPVGFEEDSEYLGSAWKPLVDCTLAVPGAVRFVSDIDAFRYVTLLFLLRRPDLSLISVWHPSFLTLLLDALALDWELLLDDIKRGMIRPPSPLPARVEADLGARLGPNPRRADELKASGPRNLGRIWPHLRIVSCWAEGHAALYLDQLKMALPGVQIQPKGLLATEAVVTIPFGGLTPLAIRSHFFEFLRDGRTYLAHELVPDAVYSVVVTTGGGLYRYRLEDRVQVNGFVGRTPSLKFLGKEDHVSDLCGEKLNESFVAAALREACAHLGVAPRFALLAPDLSASRPGYTLYLDADRAPASVLASLFDDCLAHNPQYRYCRTLGQLGSVRLFHASSPMYPAYVERCRAMGQRLGDIKPLALSARPGWSGVFAGRYDEVDIAASEPPRAAGARR
jgi:GH3 auxin-responsive promoter